MNTVELEVQGMTCGSCVKHVTKALQSVPGVSRVEVDLANGRAQVEGDFPTGTQPLIDALASEDYPSKLVSGTPTPLSPKTGGCHTSQGSKSGCCCK
jgi:copper chaperone CopZ